MVEEDPYAAATGETAKPAAEAKPKVEKPTEPELPEVENYFCIDRAPTADETKVAKAYGRAHFSDEQRAQLAKHAGAINILFVMLQARKHGATTFLDTMRLIDPNFKEESASEPFQPTQGTLV